MEINKVYNMDCLEGIKKIGGAQLRPRYAILHTSAV